MTAQDLMRRAYLVGLLNTLLVSLIGIILCTILGVIIGVARLSPNYLINKTASFYVEFFRNVPLLITNILSGILLH
jgi:general L-amino acid transport system permease protein